MPAEHFGQLTSLKVSVIVDFHFIFVVTPQITSLCGNIFTTGHFILCL